jgi:peptide/nickel transport system permease protein
MLGYLANRTLLMIPTLVGVAILIFFMLRVVPGDIVEVKLRGDGGSVTQETIEKERARLGLDQPMIVQFGQWMTGLATLNLGNSMWTDRPVVEEIGLRLELTLQVALMATLIAILIAIPLGTLSALYKDTWIDYAIRLVTIAGLAVPSFWLGMIIILGLLYLFNWLPPITYTPFYVDPVANISQLIWPALAVGYRYSAVVARMVRSSIVEVMKEDYIRTARAKGVYEKLVVSRHAMRNAMLPAITVIGLEFAFLIGGLVVTEQVFNLNGLGRLFVQAISRNDFVLIQSIVMLIAVVFIVTNLIVDLLYAWLDPRIRYGSK